MNRPPMATAARVVAEPQQGLLEVGLRAGFGRIVTSEIEPPNRIVASEIEPPNHIVASEIEVPNMLANLV